MEIVVVLVVIGVVLGVVLAFVGPRLRSRGPELEPPARPSVGRAPEVDAGAPEGDVDVLEPPVTEAPPEVVAPVRPSFRDRLAKARGTVSGYLGSILSAVPSTTRPGTTSRRP